MGEARNPGPPRILRRPSVRSNRFEILSSDDEQVEVPSTVPASEGAVRVARRRSLVILSDSIPVAHRVLQPTIPDAGSEDTQHHIIGTPVVSDIEDPASDDTVSVAGGAHVGEEASVFSEDFEKVAGDVAPSEVESDPKEPADRQVHTIRQRGLDQPLDFESGRSRRGCGRPESSTSHAR